MFYIIYIVILFTIGIIVSVIVFKSMKGKISQLDNLIKKNTVTENMLLNWISIKQDKHNICNFFTEHDIKKIAIYGMGPVGQRLYRELENTGVSVVFSVDQNAMNIYSEIPVLTMEDEWPEIDAIIVTPIFYYESIRKCIENKIVCAVFSLDDIIYEC